MISQLNRKHSITLIDDHEIVRKAIAAMVNAFPNFEAIADVGGFRELEKSLRDFRVPDILLLDIMMPEKNGFEVAEWMREFYPQVKILALSSEGDGVTIAKIIRKGAKGYLNKSVGPAELQLALETILRGDSYLSQKDFNTFSETLQNSNYFKIENIVLTDKEKEFLKWACTELSYKEIAKKMFMGIRSIEDFKDKLLEKLGVHTRHELAVFAVKNGYA